MFFCEPLLVLDTASWSYITDQNIYLRPAGCLLFLRP